MVEEYNSLVKEVLSAYIEDVTKAMREIQNDQHHMLPLSNILFNNNPDHDEEIFEYCLHHHYSQESNNSSISPFSGLTHTQFIENLSTATEAFNLVYDMDVSSRMIPFFDIDNRDHSNTTYLLNSYAVDFFKIGSDRLLIEENELYIFFTYRFLSSSQVYHNFPRSFRKSIGFIE